MEIVIGLLIGFGLGYAVCWIKRGLEFKRMLDESRERIRQARVTLN